MAAPQIEYILTKQNQSTGYFLGFLAVTAFSVTLPATRVAVSYFDPSWVGLGRSLLASIPALLLLAITRQALPTRRQFMRLSIVAAGVVIGFPLFSSWAMQALPASHAGIIIAILPLLTAIVAAKRTKQRPSKGFWLSSVTGGILVLIYSVWSSAGLLQSEHGLLLLAALAAAIGYAEGGLLTKELGAWQVICWALIIATPFNLLVLLLSTYNAGAMDQTLTTLYTAPWQAWASFAYVSLVSQLLAFFLWYKALAIGGIVKVSQIQSLQPFMTIFISMLLLNEQVSALSIVFCIAVVFTVMIGRKMPVYS